MNKSKKELVELLGLPPQTIQYYTDQGLVIPAENPRGRGVTRRYSEFNIFELLLIKELAKLGNDLKTIKQIMDHLRPSKGKPLVFSTEGGKEVLVLLDAHTKKGKLIRAATDKDGNVKVKMKDHTTMQVIALHTLREKVWSKVPQ